MVTICPSWKYRTKRSAILLALLHCKKNETSDERDVKKSMVILCPFTEPENRNYIFP